MEVVKLPFAKDMVTTQGGVGEGRDEEVEE